MVDGRAKDRISGMKKQGHNRRAGIAVMAWPLLMVLGIISLEATATPAQAQAQGALAMTMAGTREGGAADGLVQRMPMLADFRWSGTAQQGGVMQGYRPASVATLFLGDIPIEVAEDGQFLLAFDRDAPSRMILTVRMKDGREHQLSIAVAAGNWRIEHVNAPMRGAAASSAEFARRRPAEIAQIQEARAQEVVSDGWRQNFSWPVTGRFSGFFGAQRIYQGVAGSYHSGTDVAVAAGTPFVAPADGVVVLAAAAPFTLEGNLLIISHGMGLSSAFLHCQRLDVKLGDIVRQGQQLGTVGATGRATGPHMHWGVSWRGQRLDPGNLTKQRAAGGV